MLPQSTSRQELRPNEVHGLNAERRTTEANLVGAEGTVECRKECKIQWRDRYESTLVFSTGGIP